MLAGGTSISASIVAGIYAVKGHGDPANPFGDLAPFFDVPSGGNGGCGSYMCQAGPGFDGPTGMGSPDAGQTAPARPSGVPAPPVRRNTRTLSRKEAARYARRALAKAYGRRFKRRRNYRMSCHSGKRFTVTCRASWRSGRNRYAASVRVAYPAARGR
jgi:hypothetical protein